MLFKIRNTNFLSPLEPATSLSQSDPFSLPLQEVRPLKFIRPDSITKSFQRVLKKHGLKVMRFHDLRHSTASILYDKGWDLKAIQAWLGHADIETTSDIYTHISNERSKALAQNLEHTFTIQR